MFVIVSFCEMDQLNGPSPPRFRSPAEYLSGASPRCFLRPFVSRRAGSFSVFYSLPVFYSQISAWYHYFLVSFQMRYVYYELTFLEYASLFLSSSTAVPRSPTIAACCWLATNEHFLKKLTERASVSRLSKKLTYGTRFGEVVGISLLTARVYLTTQCMRPSKRI